MCHGDVSRDTPGGRRRRAAGAEARGVEAWGVEAWGAETWGAGAGRRNRLDLAVQLDFRHISYILQIQLPKKFQKTPHLVKI